MAFIIRWVNFRDMGQGWGLKIKMKDCKKNQRSMYYALYSDKIPILDDDGNNTFEYTKGYQAPVLFKGCLSTGQSNAEETPFGANVTYDRIVSTVNTSLPIDEHSLIWIKNTPSVNDDGSSADYKVSAPPIDGLNSLRIAIKKRQ